MRVRELMSTPALTVGEDATLEEVATLMLERRVGCAPVVDAQGDLVGIITETDFATKERGIPFAFMKFPQIFGRWVQAAGVEPLYEEGRTMKAREIMTTPVDVVEEDDTVDLAVEVMLRQDVKRLPVVRGGRPVGVIARHDLLRLVAKRLRGRA